MAVAVKLEGTEVAMAAMAASVVTVGWVQKEGSVGEG